MESQVGEESRDGVEREEAQELCGGSCSLVRHTEAPLGQENLSSFRFLTSL